MNDRPIPFVNSTVNKEFALKPLEEAAEIFGAYQSYDKSNCDTEEILDECADVIQATINLMYGIYLEENDKSYDLLNIPEFYEWVGHYIKRCTIRNMERGRI